MVDVGLPVSSVDRVGRWEFGNRYAMNSIQSSRDAAGVGTIGSGCSPKYSVYHRWIGLPCTMERGQRGSRQFQVIILYQYAIVLCKARGGEASVQTEVLPRVDDFRAGDWFRRRVGIVVPDNRLSDEAAGEPTFHDPLHVGRSLPIQNHAGNHGVTASAKPPPNCLRVTVLAEPLDRIRDRGFDRCLRQSQLFYRLGWINITVL
jgi:hypothetical protein